MRRLAAVLCALLAASGLDAASRGFAAQLNVDRHRLLMSPGSSTQVNVFGASTVIVRSAPDVVSVVFDAPTRTLRISARRIGNGPIEIVDPQGESEIIFVTVVAPCGTIPPQTQVALVGTPAAPFALAEIRASLRHTSQLQPGCDVTLDLQDSGVPALDKLKVTFDVGVKLSGANSVEVAGHTQAVITIDPSLLAREPATLMYSDDPETAGADGVLFRSTTLVDATHSARLYAYHESGDAGRSVYAIFRTTGSSRLQLVGSSIGPAGDYNCAGHEATLVYLRRRSTREGIAVNVSASAPYVLQLNSRPMPAHSVAVGIFDVHLAGGDPVQVSVVTASASRNPVSLLDGPELPSDGHHRRGEYALQSERPVVLSYAAGGDDVSAGVGYAQTGADPEFVTRRPDGWLLTGEYGILRSIRLNLKNPGTAPRTVYLFEIPANGADTTTVWFDGDQLPIEIPRVVDPNTRYLVRSFTLAPQQSLSTNMLFMADGASWYPLVIGLTTTQPAPVPPQTFGTCFDAIKSTIGRLP